MGVVPVNKEDCLIEGEHPKECARCNSELPCWFPRLPPGYEDQFAVWARAWRSAHPDEDDINHSLDQALVGFVELVEKATYANAAPALHDWSVADAQAAFARSINEMKQACQVAMEYVGSRTTDFASRVYNCFQNAKARPQKAEEGAPALRAEEDAIAAARARISAQLGIVSLQAQADNAASEA